MPCSEVIRTVVVFNFSVKTLSSCCQQSAMICCVVTIGKAGCVSVLSNPQGTVEVFSTHTGSLTYQHSLPVWRASVLEPESRPPSGILSDVTLASP